MEKRVQIPAILLIVTAVGTFLMGLMSLFSSTWMLEVIEKLDMPEEQLEQMRAQMGEPSALSIGYTIVFVMGSAVLIGLGAMRMKELRSYPLAMTASILAMIPCFSSCCCVIGLPVGIWALIVLLDKDVKAAFDAPVPPPLA